MILATSDLLLDAHLAAGLLLVIFAAALAVLLPRELRFLASAEPHWRRLFIALNLAIILGVLLVLVPPLVVAKPQLSEFIVISVGFVVMWGAAIWAGIVRYLYIYRILLGMHHGSKDRPAGKKPQLEEPHDK